MSYYMLFKHSPRQALDEPFGIHGAGENMNALCVFSSDEAAAAARAAAAPGYYLEAERAERRRLSEQLEAERGRGFWSRLFGGGYEKPS